MMVAGTWLRPAYYGQAARRDAIAEEVAAVRDEGRADRCLDARKDRDCAGRTPPSFSTGSISPAHLKQPVDRARYGLMTDATGSVTDDGVVCRFADQHFFVTATTAGVDAVVRHVPGNAQWQLDVDIAN